MSIPRKREHKTARRSKCRVKIRKMEVQTGIVTKNNNIHAKTNDGRSRSDSAVRRMSCKVDPSSN
eukprot:5040632-Amphidinium_carterae.4